jgi:hypothetical protein
MDAPPDQTNSTVNLDLGNLAELHLVALNPAHVTHVRLTGTHQGTNRKMEIFLVNGGTVGMMFDDPVEAELVFAELCSSIGGNGTGGVATSIDRSGLRRAILDDSTLDPA